MIKRRGPRTEPCGTPKKTGMEGGETTFAFHTERTRGQIRFEPVKDSPSYSKPRGKTDELCRRIPSNSALV